jgi:hypothetical protein
MRPTFSNDKLMLSGYQQQFNSASTTWLVQGAQHVTCHTGSNELGINEGIRPASRYPLSPEPRPFDRQIIQGQGHGDLDPGSPLKTHMCPSAMSIRAPAISPLLPRRSIGFWGQFSRIQHEIPSGTAYQAALRLGIFSSHKFLLHTTRSWEDIHVKKQDLEVQTLPTARSCW